MNRHGLTFWYSMSRVPLFRERERERERESVCVCVCEEGGLLNYQHDRTINMDHNLLNVFLKNTRADFYLKLWMSHVLMDNALFDTFKIPSIAKHIMVCDADGWTFYFITTIWSIRRHIIPIISWRFNEENVNLKINSRYL